MRSLQSIGVGAILFSLALFVFSCGSNSNSHDHGEGEHPHESAGHDHDGAAHGEGTAYTAAYVCPMHCEGSGSETAGTCPVCKMDYVAQAEHTKDGHTH
jgi:hypothetical protein